MAEVRAWAVEPLSELAAPVCRDGSEVAARAGVRPAELVVTAGFLMWGLEGAPPAAEPRLAGVDCCLRGGPEVAAMAVETLAELAAPSGCVKGGPEVVARAVRGGAGRARGPACWARPLS